MDIQRLAGLGTVIIVAVGAIVFLVRYSVPSPAPQVDVVTGYPADRYPARHSVTTGALTALVATQLRMLALYRHLPAGSDSAIWLRTFLVELREIMDTFFHDTATTEIYAAPAPLDSLV